MGKRLTAQEAIRLYLIILGFFLGFYLVGLLLGGSYLEMGVTEQAGPVDVPSQEEEMASSSPEALVETGDLGFYDELKGQDSEGASQGEGSVASPESESDTAVSNRQWEESAGTESAEEQQFTVQVAALDTRAEAEEFLLRLEARGFDGRVSEPSGFGDRYYRVWVGSFGTREAAADLEADLKEAGFLTYVREMD